MLPMPAGREASQDGGSVEYERHRPERTLLYQLVEEYYPAFEAQWAAEGKMLPDYVTNLVGTLSIQVHQPNREPHGSRIGITV